MSSELARLEIRVDSIAAEVAANRMDRLSKGGKRAESATNRLAGAFMRFAAPAAVLATATAALTEIVNVSRRFQDMEARLVTATGSMEGAAVAMEAIKDLAIETPYDLEQITNGFIRLANLGLSPSERALRSYGNTASATGKTLNQLVEAVADAATFEFERLKEFGIKANQMGDRVSFTFRGVTTTVEKSSKAVTDYLTALGENEFAGEMTRRMETIGGAISNMQDQWTIAVNNIAETGIGDAMEEGFRTATSTLELFNNSLESGEMEALIDAQVKRWDFMFDSISDGVDFAGELWSQVPAEWKGYFKTAVDGLIDYWKYFVEYFQYGLARVGIEFDYLVGTVDMKFTQISAIIGNEFDHIAARSKAIGESIAHALDPFAEGEFDLTSKLIEIDKHYVALGHSIKKHNTFYDEQRDAAIAAAEAELEANKKTYDNRVNGAKFLRQELIAERNLRKKLAKDRLAQFGQDQSGGETLAEQRKREKEEQARENEFNKLVDSLRTEEEVIAESYQRRLQIILDNTQAGSDARTELQQRLNEQYEKDILGEDEVDTYEAKIEREKAYFENRRNLILNSSQLTEEQRTKLEAKLTKKRNDTLAKLEYERASSVFNASESIFDGLSSIARDFAGEQSGIFKAMFLASKAFAIADSVIKIQQGIANAAALPFPANLGAMATVVGATASIVSTIKSTQMQFAGAFDNGGVIPRGQFGLVGERGPELIMGPVNIAGRNETSRRFREMDQGGSGSGGAVVNIHNYAGAAVTTNTRPDGGVDVYVRKDEFSAMLYGEASNPSSDFNEAQDGLYMRERA